MVANDLRKLMIDNPSESYYVKKFMGGGHTTVYAYQLLTKEFIDLLGANQLNMSVYQKNSEQEYIKIM